MKYSQFEPAEVQSPDSGVRSPYLTLAEAAAYCRRSAKTLSNHKALGRLKAVPGTRPPLFKVEDLNRWMNGTQG